MVEDIEQFKRLIKEKKILTVDEMQRESLELIKKIPDFQEKYEKVIRARGYVLEPSTTLEIAFNELILNTGGEDIVIDNEKKELKIITGIKDNLGGLSFKQKANLVQEIIIKRLDKSEKFFKQNWSEDFNKFVAIRDIFVHVPINWLSPELEFNVNPPYKHFFKLNPHWKNVSVAFDEFMKIQKFILDIIPIYIRHILLNKQLISSILLGIDLEDAPEDNKKNNN